MMLTMVHHARFKLKAIVVFLTRNTIIIRVLSAAINLLVMQTAQENNARALHADLIRSCGVDMPDAEMDLLGTGVNWRCVVSLSPRSCVIHCFHLRAPEYLTIFREGEWETATARTASASETVDAVRSWLLGAKSAELYDRFAFVDTRKRALEQIKKEVLQVASDLQPGSQLAYWGSGIYKLWFRTETRSAVIYFYGKDEQATVNCHWDGCELFSFKNAVTATLAAVLKRWLSDNALPSAMRAEFPTLPIGDLADYYERGLPIEGEFVDSWNRMENFFDNEHFRPRVRVLRLIRELREAGYDLNLRAGQSLFFLTLSRSRRHGLRSDQGFIAFQFGFHDDLMKVTLKHGPEEQSITTPVSITSELVTLLNRLLLLPID